MVREPRTARGHSTRESIIAAAADLVGKRGAQATGLDEIISRAGVSKSQLYHYFSNKDELVRAVVARQTERVLNAQLALIEQLDSWDAIQRWFDWIVAVQQRQHCVGGCPIGSLANELADRDESARRDLAGSFRRWRAYLERGLTQMQAGGTLASQADVETLALATMASIQGGLLLTRTERSVRPIRVALDMALTNLKLWQTPN